MVFIAECRLSHELKTSHFRVCLYELLLLLLILLLLRARLH
jgi:hypothetical protein